MKRKGGFVFVVVMSLLLFSSCTSIDVAKYSTAATDKATAASMVVIYPSAHDGTDLSYLGQVIVNAGVGHPINATIELLKLEAVKLGGNAIMNIRNTPIDWIRERWIADVVYVKPQ